MRPRLDPSLFPVEPGNTSIHIVAGGAHDCDTQAGSESISGCTRKTHRFTLLRVELMIVTRRLDPSLFPVVLGKRIDSKCCVRSSQS